MTSFCSRDPPQFPYMLSRLHVPWQVIALWKHNYHYPELISLLHYPGCNVGFGINFKNGEGNQNGGVAPSEQWIAQSLHQFSKSWGPEALLLISWFKQLYAVGAGHPKSQNAEKCSSLEHMQIIEKSSSWSAFIHDVCNDKVLIKVFQEFELKLYL